LHFSFYLAETKEKDVKLFFEHLGFEWLPFELALERLTFDNANSPRWVAPRASLFEKRGQTPLLSY